MTPEAAGDPHLLAELTQQASAAGSVLTDVSAAREWGLPLPPWIGLSTASVSLAVPPTQARSGRTGVRGRRLLLPPGHVTEVSGLIVTTPARTWIDCAACLPAGHLIAMGDALLRRELASIADIHEVIGWARGRRGVAVARVAAAHLDARSQSPGESLARAALVLDGIEPPECNAEIFDDGQWLARADMAWRRQRVIVEYDGIVHLPEEQRRKDALRRNLLTEAGWTVLVFTAADLKHPHRMCALVRSALVRTIAA